MGFFSKELLDRIRQAKQGTSALVEPSAPIIPNIAALPNITNLPNIANIRPALPDLSKIPAINLPKIDFSNIPQGIKIPSIPNIPQIPTPIVSRPAPIQPRPAPTPIVSRPAPIQPRPAPTPAPIVSQPPSAPAGGTFMASPSVVVFGPDGKMYGSPAAARAAGVTDYTMTPPSARYLPFPPVAQETTVEPISSAPITQPVAQETIVESLPSVPVTQPAAQDTIAEFLANIPVSGTAPTNQVDPVLKGITPTEVLSDPFVRELYFGSPDTPGLIAQATEAAQKSFLDQPAILQQTAGLSPFEQEARGLAAAGIGSYEPFLREASGAYRGGLGSLYGSIGFGGPSARDYLGMSLQQYDPRMMGAFYDPFEQQVVQQTISDALQAAAQQDIQQRAADISRGGESAFGSRARLGAEERQRALGRGLAESLGRIRSGGFQSAQERALQELERQRSGARSAAQLESGFGGQLSQAQRLYGADISGLGQMGQQLRGADISQLTGLGSTARGIEEQRLAREYAQQQATRQAPLQATQFVKGFAPQYVPGKTQIQKEYGMPVDPLTYGLSTAFGTYAQFAPQQQQQQTQQAGIAGLPQGQFTFSGGYPQQTPTYGGYQPTPYSTPGGYI